MSLDEIGSSRPSRTALGCLARALTAVIGFATWRNSRRSTEDIRRVFLTNQTAFERISQMICEDVSSRHVWQGHILMQGLSPSSQSVDGLSWDRQAEYRSLQLKLSRADGFSCSGGVANLCVEDWTLLFPYRRGYAHYPGLDAGPKSLVDDLDSYFISKTAYVRISPQWFLFKERD